MRRNGFAHHRTGTGHQVEDARSNTCLLRQVGDQVGGQRGDLAPLENRGAACRQRSPDLHRHRAQRDVPGRDHSRDTSGDLVNLGTTDGLAPDHVLQGIGEDAQILDRPSRRPERGGDRLAHLGRHHVAGLVGTGLNEVGQRPQDLRPVLGTRVRPLGQSRRCRGDGLIHIRWTPEPDGRDRELRRRIDHDSDLIARGIHPLAVDKDLLPLDHGSPPLSLNSAFGYECTAGYGCSRAGPRRGRRPLRSRPGPLNPLLEHRH